MVFHGDDAMRRATAARRIGVVGAVLSCVLLTLTSASARAYRPHQPPVSAVDARTGKQLPPNPLLHHGSRVILTVPGFAPRTKVVVALVGVRHIGTMRASRRGFVVYRYTVPNWLRPGHHTLIFSGPAPPTKHRPAKPVRSRPRKDRQSFVVTVPYDPPWPFRTGAQQRDPGGPAGHHGTSGGSVGPPSATGMNLLPLLVIGSAAIVLGGIALATGRRRRDYL